MPNDAPLFGLRHSFGIHSAFGFTHSSFQPNKPSCHTATNSATRVSQNRSLKEARQQSPGQVSRSEAQPWVGTRTNTLLPRALKGRGIDGRDEAGSRLANPLPRPFRALKNQDTPLLNPGLRSPPCGRACPGLRCHAPSEPLKNQSKPPTKFTTHRPPPIAHRPSPIAHRPSPIAHRHQSNHPSTIPASTFFRHSDLLIRHSIGSCSPMLLPASKSLAIITALILAGIILPFLFWGERFDAALSLDGARAWMADFGAWAWLAGIVLLIADIALPIPSTIVMSALGLTYGWFVGGCIASVGSFLSGLVAYGFCRWFGRPAARWIAGDEALSKGASIFDKQGGWLVALSRWMPVLPEAVACLAGLVKMDLRRFLIALACGSLPVGFAFAAIGALGNVHPGWAIALSGLVPVALWMAARRYLK
jgi:uncharacterized membrane protein YdjX (TVP38/TMEM64 family)